MRKLISVRSHSIALLRAPVPSWTLPLLWQSHIPPVAPSRVPYVRNYAISAHTNGKYCQAFCMLPPSAVLHYAPSTSAVHDARKCNQHTPTHRPAKGYMGFGGEAAQSATYRCSAAHGQWRCTHEAGVRGRYEGLATKQGVVLRTGDGGPQRRLVTCARMSPWRQQGCATCRCSPTRFRCAAGWTPLPRAGVEPDS